MLADRLDGGRARDGERAGDRCHGRTGRTQPRIRLDPVFEQAARRTAPARIPARADRTRVEWVNGIPPNMDIGSIAGSGSGLNRSLSIHQGHVKCARVSSPRWSWKPHGGGRMVQLVVVGGIGLLAGVLSGLFGIGGGIVIVPLLVLCVGLTITQAAGTSLAALLLPVGALGALEYWRGGFVDIALRRRPGRGTAAGRLRRRSPRHLAAGGDGATCLRSPARDRGDPLHLLQLARGPDQPRMGAAQVRQRCDEAGGR